MLDGSHYFECACGSDEHTLKFILNKDDNEIYTNIFLTQGEGFFGRAWVGIKYAFGYKSKYGHWDSFILKSKDAKRLRNLLDELER